MARRKEAEEYKARCGITRLRINVICALCIAFRRVTNLVRRADSPIIKYNGDFIAPPASRKWRDFTMPYLLLYILENYRSTLYALK